MAEDERVCPPPGALSTSRYSLRRLASPVSASCSAWCSFSSACSRSVSCGELALGDVLEHRDRERGLAVGVALERRGDLRPDHLAVLAEAALLELVRLALAGDQLPEEREVVLDVVGVGVLAEAHLRELRGRVAEHLLHRGVRLDHAPARIDAQDADGGALEDHAVAREHLDLAALRGELGGVALALQDERVVELDLRLPQVGDVDDHRGHADDRSVGREDRVADRAERVLAVRRTGRWPAPPGRRPACPSRAPAASAGMICAAISGKTSAIVLPRCPRASLSSKRPEDAR